MHKAESLVPRNSQQSQGNGPPDAKLRARGQRLGETGQLHPVAARGGEEVCVCGRGVPPGGPKGWARRQEAEGARARGPRHQVESVLRAQGAHHLPADLLSQAHPLPL